MFKQSISKMNNGKAGRPSSLLQEMAVGEAGVEMITNLVHRIKVDGLIAAERQLALLQTVIREKEIIKKEKTAVD